MENDIVIASSENEVLESVSFLVEGENMLNKEIALLRNESVKERVQINLLDEHLGDEPRESMVEKGMEIMVQQEETLRVEEVNSREDEPRESSCARLLGC